MVALRKSGRQVSVMLPLPSTEVAVVIRIVLVPFVMVTVSMLMNAVVAFVLAFLIVIALVATMAVALCNRKGCGESQTQ